MLASANGKGKKRSKQLRYRGWDDATNLRRISVGDGNVYLPKHEPLQKGFHQ